MVKSLSSKEKHPPPWEGSAARLVRTSPCNDAAQNATFLLSARGRGTVF